MHSGGEYVVPLRPSSPVPVQRAAPRPVSTGIGEGPGTELVAIFTTMAVPKCGQCVSMARRMNEWGARGCRDAGNRETILKHLRTQVAGLTWRRRIELAVRTAVSDPALAFAINPLDPSASLLDEAIRRAELKSPSPPDVLPNSPDPGTSPDRSNGVRENINDDANEGSGPVRDGGDSAGGGGGAPTPVRLTDPAGDVGAARDGDGGEGGAAGGGEPGGGVDADGAPGGRNENDGNGGPSVGDAAGVPSGAGGVAEGAGGTVRDHDGDAGVRRPTAVRNTAKVTWCVGVTTCPQRRADLCPKTLQSLCRGGFNGPARPWLFVDGCDDLQGWRREYDADDPGSLVMGVTCRYPLVRAFGSWVLAVTEMWYRNPLADRYAVFQDDVEVVANLRQYLDTVVLQPKTYWNLWLGPWNENPRNFGAGRRPTPPPWLTDPTFVGFAPGDQGGRGAMGLVFDRETAQLMAGCSYFAGRPAHQPRGPSTAWELHPRGFKFIDGAVVDALKPLGYVELVHSPSLVRHVGTISVMEKRPNVTFHDPNMPKKWWGPEFEGRTFPGAEYDAMQLAWT